MQRSHLMLAMASFTLMACNDAVTPPLPRPATENLGQVVLLDGIVRLSATGTPRFVLQLVDGQVIALYGEEAGWLGAVVGAEVLVVAERTGAYKADVQRFVVVSVLDHPVRDGVLVQSETGGYSLQLANGNRSGVIDPPDELMELVGSRVWLAGPESSPPFAFGVIKSSVSVQ